MYNEASASMAIIYIFPDYFRLPQIKSLACHHGCIDPIVGDMSRIDLVRKNLLTNLFRNCHKRNNWEKLRQKITYKYRKNRKDNKSNKNRDLEKKEAKKDPEMSANIANIAKVTRIFFLPAQNTRDKYRKNRKNNKFNKILDLEKKKPRRAPKCPQISQK